MRKMAKLYFKYGAMGSSKSAQALITKFNYEELGMTVWLIKPSIDTRDGADLIRSRIGLECRARVITPNESIIAAYREAGRHDVSPEEGIVHMLAVVNAGEADIAPADLPCFVSANCFLRAVVIGKYKVAQQFPTAAVEGRL